MRQTRFQVRQLAVSSYPLRSVPRIAMRPINDDSASACCSDPLPRLIARIRRGDEAAATTLVRHYEAELRMEARLRLRNRRLRQLLDSTDICQSVFLSFFTRAAAGQFELHSREDLMGLLARMVKHKVIDQARRSQAARRDQRRTFRLDESVAVSVPDAVAPSPPEQVSLRELVQQCRSRMTGQEREVSGLRAQGHSYEEIAKSLGKRPDAVRKSLDRALLRLSRELPLGDPASSG